ncbi:MAG: hypothetical protein ACYCV4_12115 [Dermatophilaceae bacterium]
MSDAPNYASLVTPTGNAQAPVHRWYHLKEAYSHLLLWRLLKDLELTERRSLTVVDPFSGSGTTCVSALDLVADGELERVDVVAYEANPFLHSLSSAKCAAILAPPDGYLDVAAEVIAAASDPSAGMSPMPALSTFHRPQYFEDAAMRALRRIRFAIDQHAEATPASAKLLRVALARAVEASGALRKDGRTLRYVPGKVQSSPIDAFAAAAQVQADDLAGRPLENASALVIHGDSREGLAVSDGWADLVVFSPPYPNNIDYTEVYKLENWMLGLISTQEDFANARRRSLRSHGSLNWEEAYTALESIESGRALDILRPILASVPDDRYARKRRQLVLGYANDMLVVLREAQRVLKPGGKMVCVVGNSLHGHGDNRLLLAADLVIAELATLAGLDVERVDVARYPRRKRIDSHLLRESLVVCSKAGE